MLREIVSTLMILEGGLLMAACLFPGSDLYVVSVLRNHPEFFPPTRLAELVAIVGILRRLGALFGATCCVAGFAARRGKPWGRWLAVAMSVINLGLVVFVPLGVAGLFAYLREAQVKAAIEEAPPATGERPEPISHLLTMVMSVGLVVYFSQYLQRIGVELDLPVTGMERLGLLWILIGQLFFGLIHEVGHYGAAWLTGFRFHEVRVGPFLWEKRPGGTWGFRFSFPQMLAGSGYLLAIPQGADGLRFNWILVAAAGPATSLLLALLGFLAIVSMRGTEFAPYWWQAAYVTALCAADFAANMVPVGLSDGATLMHTMFGTRRGVGIVAGLEAAMLNDRARRDAGIMDPVELVETRKQALEQMKKSVEPPGLPQVMQRIEFAQAALRGRRLDDAMTALQEVAQTLPTIEVVPELVRFQYWATLFDTATARRQFTTAAEAREKGLELGALIGPEKLDWEDWVPVRVACARMWMSDGEYVHALKAVQEARARCPERRSVTGHAAELLAVEAECELRLGRPEAAEGLIEAAIDVASSLADAQKATAMELLANTATRLSLAGEYGCAEPLFAAAIASMIRTASPGLLTGYRTAWAIALYENGRLEDSAQVLAQVDPSATQMALDIQTLRANLLMAEDKAAEALEVLSPFFAGEPPPPPPKVEPESEGELFGPPQEAPQGFQDIDRHQLNLARGRALRSWAFFRSGNVDAALADARQACDELMPYEFPDAAPALMTLALAVAEENSSLAEAYVHESVRLITQTTLLSATTKASRLTELARSMVQVNRREWAKTLLEHAARYRSQAKPHSMNAAANTHR